MKHSTSAAIIVACIAGTACTPAPPAAEARSTAGIDSLTARLVDAYRKHDSHAYASLYTDTAVFEWAGFGALRGRAALSAMARENWAPMRAMDLTVTAATRRLATDHATEFGAFQHSWTDSAGTRTTEYGRFVWMLVPARNGGWRIDRFFGFADSMRTAAPGTPLTTRR